MKNIQKPELGEWVKVFAPATVANMICGFDILGLALDAPGDEVLMRVVQQPGVTIQAIHGDGGRLPWDPAKNTVSATVIALLESLQINDVGLSIELFKKMPIGSGLGSSSASTVAGLVAANYLLGSPLSPQDLLPFAMQGEALACGHGHADNVAPSLMGGITLIRSYEPLDVIALPVPEDLHVAVLFPDVDVPTRDARQMIKKKVFLQDAVQQWGNIAGLIAGLYASDYALIGRSLKDELIEPTRSILIPAFDQLKSIALKQGALSFGISGSGPSVVAFTTSEQQAHAIVQEQYGHLQQLEIDAFTYVSKINVQGPRVLEASKISTYEVL